MLKLEELVFKKAAGKARFMGQDVAVSLVGEGLLADLREACPCPFVNGPYDEGLHARIQADRGRMEILTLAAAMDVAVTVRRTVPTSGGTSRTETLQVTAASASAREDRAENQALMKAWCDAVWARLAPLPDREWKGVRAEYARLEGLDLYAEAVSFSSPPSTPTPMVVGGGAGGVGAGGGSGEGGSGEPA